MTITNIKWDVECEEDLDFLPTDIDLMKMLNTVVVEAVYKE